MSEPTNSADTRASLRVQVTAIETLLGQALAAIADVANEVGVGLESEVDEPEVEVEPPAPPSIEMVQVPAGVLPNGVAGQRGPLAVSPFAMAATATTIEQWNAVCELPLVLIPLTPEEVPEGEEYKLQHPKTRVTWHECNEFCARLSAATGKNYRLPVEAEWEFACRAGTTTAFNNGRDELTTDEANFDGHYNGVTEVRKFAPNAWGLYDMHGNVWEWTATPYNIES